MTPLEEKIDAVIKFLQENGWTVEEQCLVFDQLRYIAQQAVEEYKKNLIQYDEVVGTFELDYHQLRNKIIEEERQRILNNIDLLEQNVKPTHAEENGYGCALDDFRNIISKPNI